MSDKYRVGQRVRIRHTDAIGHTHAFDGAIVRWEPKVSMWRVDIGGVAITFDEADIHPIEDPNPDDQRDPATVPPVPSGPTQSGSGAAEPAFSTADAEA